MSSSVSASRARSLRSGSSRTAGRPGGLDRRHVPAGALDAEHVDLLADEVGSARLDRGVAAAVQHELRVARRAAAWCRRAARDRAATPSRHSGRPRPAPRDRPSALFIGALSALRPPAEAAQLVLIGRRGAARALPAAAPAPEAARRRWRRLQASLIARQANIGAGSRTVAKLRRRLAHGRAAARRAPACASRGDRLERLRSGSPARAAAAHGSARGSAPRAPVRRVRDRDLRAPARPRCFGRMPVAVLMSGCRRCGPAYPPSPSRPRRLRRPPRRPRRRRRRSASPLARPAAPLAVVSRPSAARLRRHPASALVIARVPAICVRLGDRSSARLAAPSRGSRFAAAASAAPRRGVRAAAARAVAPLRLGRSSARPSALRRLGLGSQSLRRSSSPSASVVLGVVFVLLRRPARRDGGAACATQRLGRPRRCAPARPSRSGTAARRRRWRRH